MLTGHKDCRERTKKDKKENLNRKATPNWIKAN